MAALQELPRPRAIVMSFWCWLVAGVVVGGTVALAYTRLDPMRTEFARLARDRDSGASQATIDRVASASVLIVIGTGVALCVLCLALALVLRAGRGWGRVFLAVVALIAVVYAAVVSSAVTDPMLDDLRTPVVAGLLGFTVLVLVAAVSMFLPGTTAWFRRPKGN
jgi:ABC-type sugar transport system permease subunit